MPVAELLALEFALVVAADLLGRGVSLVDGILAELHSNVVSMELMQHAAGLDLSHFESSEYQDRLERARRQAAGRNALLAQIFGQGQSIVTILTLAAGLFVYAPWLILLLAVSLIPSVVSEAKFNTRSYYLNRMRSPERRELEYLRYIGASAETAKEIKLFGLGPFLVGRFKRLADTIMRDNRRLAIQRAVWGGLFAALSTVAYYGAYAYIVWRTVDGAFTLGDLTFLAGSFLRLHGLFEQLLIGVTQIAGQSLYLDDLFSFFDIKPTITLSPDPKPFPQPIREGIVFENVGFRYPDTERWAVRGLNFTLKAGEALALVGENGAGKTTIVKLLTRLYDPDEGRILIDGIDLRDIAVDDLAPISASSSRTSSAIPSPPPRTSASAASRPSPTASASRPPPSRASRPTSSRSCRSATTSRSEAFRQRPRPLRRRVAEGGDRPRLYARRRAHHPRRADGRARRQGGGRSVPALQGAGEGQDGGADLAPLLHRAHGRPHPGAVGRPHHRIRHA